MFKNYLAILGKKIQIINLIRKMFCKLKCALTINVSECETHSHTRKWLHTCEKGFFKVSNYIFKHLFCELQPRADIKISSWPLICVSTDVEQMKYNIQHARNSIQITAFEKQMMI